MTRRRKQQCKYLVADFLSAVLVWLCFLLFRWLVYEGRVFGTDTVLVPMFGFYEPLLVYPLGCLAVYYFSGYYVRPFRKRLGQEFLTTLISALVIALASFFCVIINDKVVDYHHYVVSLVTLFVLQFVLSYLPRLYLSLASRKDTPKNEVVIGRSDALSESELYRRIGEVYPTGKDILVEPSMYDILTGAARIGELEEAPYIRITDSHMSDAGIAVKRAADICIAVLVMIVLSPVYLLIALCIRRDSFGPVIYRQERIGLHGVPFRILKFRTMYVGAETDTPRLSADDDPRVTPVGRFLRKYRLDELPQMWNILRGEMSVVGPRPERAYFIRQIEERAPYYCLLYKIRPGLTSWGPVRVGYTDTVDKMVERLKYDLAYMENMSLWLDIKILFHTIGVILDGKGK